MLEKFSQVFDVMKDFYFEYSQQLIDQADLQQGDKEPENGLDKLIKQTSEIKKQILNEK